MALLTYERYVDLTGDETSAASAVEAKIVRAEREVRRILWRPLEFGTYTELAPVHAHGRAYPRAVPLASVPVSATYALEDTVTLRYVYADSLAGPVSPGDYQEYYDSGASSGYRELAGQATITYTGGWTDLNAPLPVLLAICGLVRLSLNPTAETTFMEGVTAVRNGDVSLSFGKALVGTPFTRMLLNIQDALLPFRWKDGGA